MRQQAYPSNLYKFICAALAATAMTAMFSAISFAGPSVRSENGKHFDKDGNPTYDIKKDGTVDWFTYSGFRRYHSECHVCHGPDGLGSSYAPALRDSLKTMTYDQFQEVVVNGRKIVRPDKISEMPALGTNRNVMCYLDDIYIYLKARADGALPRGRPQKRVAKSKETGEEESACID